MTISSSLADPLPADPILAAVQWIEGTVLGTVATVIAVIAVAAIGLRMLSGRMDLRQAMATIVGCFIVFGASSIVAGLRSAIDGAGSDSEQPMPMPPAPPPTPPPVVNPAPNDPYAGATMP